jgi:hypothetical protein
MRNQLLQQYHKLIGEYRNYTNPNACGIRPERVNSPQGKDMLEQIDAILTQLALPDNRVKPKDDWERVHGIWLLVAMPDDYYLPGELLRIEDSTTTVDKDGNVVKAVICRKMHEPNSRRVILIFNSANDYTFYGAENVTPGPFLM